LFQNPVGFVPSSWRKLLISYKAGICGSCNFLRGKKLFQKLKFWNSLNLFYNLFLVNNFPPLKRRNCRYRRENASPWNAQGIGAVSFFAGGKKDTSVKPGPWAVLPVGQVGARMRPK
jgi:hypothetical protein